MNNIYSHVTAHQKTSNKMHYKVRALLFHIYLTSMPDKNLKKGVRAKRKYTVCVRHGLQCTAAFIISIFALNNFSLIYLNKEQQLVNK